MRKSPLVLLTVAILSIFLITSAGVTAQNDDPTKPDRITMPAEYHAAITEVAVSILSSEIAAEVYSFSRRYGEDSEHIGSAVVAGAFDEDFPFLEAPWHHHSWDPDKNSYWFNGVPIPPRGTALEWADYYFSKAIDLYDEDKAEAYHYLGRAAHLLGDMATPAHVHLDKHYGLCIGSICPPNLGDKGDKDLFELYLDDGSQVSALYQMKVEQWDYRSARYQIPSELDLQLEHYNRTGSADDTREELWSKGPFGYTKQDGRRVDPDLFHIYYTMAELADNYASNDKYADGKVYPTIGHRDYDGSDDYDDIRDNLVPESINRIAALIQLFWDRTLHESNVDVVLIIDSSGSMGSNDPFKKRLDAAKAYLTASLAGDFVGVVDFDGGARLAAPLQQLPHNKDALIAAINTINSSGGTNIGAGIQGGCNALLNSTSSNTTKAAILLTDGKGSFSDQDSCFSSNGWPIYTFGFGRADDALLQKIAANTGGEFQRLPTSNLVCEFQAVRAKIGGGSSGPCTTWFINPLQIIDFLINLPPSTFQVTFSTSWLGSDVEMSLTSPSGRVIDRDTAAPDVTHDLGATFESYSITNPEAGEWTVTLFGADIPEGGEEVVFSHIAITGDKSNVFFPVIVNPSPIAKENDLVGTVTASGKPVEGLSILLKRGDSTGVSNVAAAVTDSMGRYSFKKVPLPQDNSGLTVRWNNDANNDDWLSTWACWEIMANTTDPNAYRCDFDIANVELLSPDHNATLSLPADFSWKKRALTTDNYEFNIADMNDYDLHWWTDPALGYVAQYSLSGLPPGFSTGDKYGWWVWVNGPDGYGLPSYYRFVTFTGSGGPLAAETTAQPFSTLKSNAELLAPPRPQPNP